VKTIKIVVLGISMKERTFVQNVLITVIVVITLQAFAISVNSTSSNYLQTSANVSVLRASGKQKKKSVINALLTVAHATTIQVYALSV
jgi:hypothetical protein